MARDQIKYFETMQISTPSTTVKLLLKGTKSLLKSLQSTQPTSGKSLQEKANGVQVNSSIFFMYLRLAGIWSLPPISSQKLDLEAPAPHCRRSVRSASLFDWCSRPDSCYIFFRSVHLFIGFFILSCPLTCVATFTDGHKLSCCRNGMEEEEAA
jgi:hypothetical protein